MGRNAEVVSKLKLVRDMLAKKGINGVIIRKQSNFSWITAGGRGFIGLASELACGYIIVTADQFLLAANNIECGRLLCEELIGVEIDTFEAPWYNDGKIKELIVEKFGNLTEDSKLEEYFKAMRIQLCGAEITRYAAASTTVAAILESVCLGIHRGITELEVAGEIAKQMWCAGLEPITMLVAADDRSEKVRHYVPTNKAASAGVIASVCVRSAGLVVSATRTVAFQDAFAQQYPELLQVERAIWEATVPGTRLCDILQLTKQAYQQYGLSDEWCNHHQGGVTGYLARELRADNTIDLMVGRQMAFAWNPSVVGAKCEDTVLLTESGLQVLTACSNKWPTHQVGDYARPAVLHR